MRLRIILIIIWFTNIDEFVGKKEEEEEIVDLGNLDQQEKRKTLLPPSGVSSTHLGAWIIWVIWISRNQKSFRIELSLPRRQPLKL